MSQVPAYQQIRDALRAEMAKLPPGARIEGEAGLAQRYGVTRVTIRHALSGLVAEGLLVRQQGRGTFVLERPAAARPLSRLTSFSEDVSHLGVEISTTMLVQEEISPPSNIRHQLALDEGAHAIHLARVRAFDGQPVAIQHAWIPAGLCPSLAWEPLRNGSLYQTLEQRFGIRLVRAEQRISAVTATREQASLLKVKQRSPLLHIERRTFDASGRPVEYALSWTTPRYVLASVLER